MSPNDTYPQHVVTAVIVAHDGAAWLPHVIDGVLEQTRPVQRVVAVDTGSRDRSGSVLAAKLGQGVVFGMDRSTGYGAAVGRALQHKAANTAVPGRPGQYWEGSGGGEHVEWIWLLHDDCEPAADALEQLLRGAAETPNAAVLGPKIMDWADRDVILEAGVTIDTVGRRITGIEPREVDQGQHDGDRDTLAVSSPGMLVRRDVWEQTRGFDTSMGLFREDVDFCWRVHAAGHRVRVITDAVVFHAQAMSRRRRNISVGRRAQLLDRRNALLTLAGNLPPGPMLRSLAGNTVISVLRALFFLVAKRVTAAVDETAALVSVLGHPLRLLRVRKMRARGRRAAYGRLRADLPPGRSFRRVAEFIAAMSGSAQQDTAGSHHASGDPSEDDDFLLTDSGLVQRFLTNPAVLLLLGLLIVTGIAERSLLSAGTLGGGALLPAADGAAGLWREYLQGFHPTGIGSSTIAPPYVAVMAALSTVLLGKAWLAVDVVLLGSVPIAGMAAYLAVRRVTASVPVRVWAAAAYALLPVAMGAISAGRLGTAAAFALVPVIGLLAGRMFSQPPRIARRAAWATGLTIALGAAFVPLLWPIALLGALLAGLALRRKGRAILRNLAIVVIVPPVLLIPWTIQLVTHPSQLLLEVGVPQAGLASPSLPARSLLLLSPGGPGLPPVWVTVGLLVAALAALAVSRRRVLVLAGWTVAVLSLLIGALVSQVAVRPIQGGTSVTAWPGAALAISAAGLLLAAAAGGDSLGLLLARGRTGLRRAAGARGLAVGLLAVVACSAPVLAGGLWLLHGVRGPIGPDNGQVVPALVTVGGNRGAQPRTLVLRSAGSGVTYALLRGHGPSLGDGDLAPAPAAAATLSRTVASLVAPAGGQAVNQAQLLARFDVGFVLMRAPVNQALAQTLDGVPGLRPVSITSTFALWRLVTTPSMVAVVEASGAVVPVPSGQVSVSGAAAPAAGGTLTVAEPAAGWHATLNGRPLAAVPSPAGSWAQAFRLPSGGGTLDVGRSDLGHTLSILFELLAAAVVGALALPGVRSVAEVQVAVEGVPAQGGVAAGRSGASGAGTSGSGTSRAGAARRGDGEPADDAAPDRVMAGSGGGHRSTGLVGNAAGGGASSLLLGDTAVTGMAGTAAGSGAPASVALDDATASYGSLGGSHSAGTTATGGHSRGGRRGGSGSRRAGQPATAAGPPEDDEAKSRGGKGRSRGLGRRGRRSDSAESPAASLPPRQDSAARGTGPDELEPAAEGGLAAGRPAARLDPTAAGRGQGRSAPAGDAGFGSADFGDDRLEAAGPLYDSSAYASGAYDAYGSPVQGPEGRERADYDRGGHEGPGYEGVGYEGAGHEGGGYGARRGGPDRAAAEHGGPDRGGPDRDSADRDSAAGSPGRRSAPGTGSRSPAGSWPYPDDARPAAPDGYSSDAYSSNPYGSGVYRGDAAHGSDARGSGGYGSGGYGSNAEASGGYRPDARGSGGYGSDTRGSGGYGSDAQGPGGYRRDAPGAGGYGSDAQGPGGYRSDALGAGGHGSDAQGSGGYRRDAPGSGGYGSDAQGPGGYRPDALGAGGHGSDAQGSGGYRSAGGPAYDSGAYQSSGAPRPVSPRQDPVRRDPGRPDPGHRDPVRRDPGRPDPGWPETRWADQRGAPPADSASWPQQQSGSSWPAHEQPSSWPSQEQPGSWSQADQPAAWPGADQPGGAGADDSLEPLPSGEPVRGAPSPGPAQHSRPWWPAPGQQDADEDERDAR